MATVVIGSDATGDPTVRLMGQVSDRALFWFFGTQDARVFVQRKLSTPVLKQRINYLTSQKNYVSYSDEFKGCVSVMLKAIAGCVAYGQEDYRVAVL